MTRKIPWWGGGLAVGLLLLPVLSGPWVVFVSQVRWGWEAVYLLLAAGVPMGLRRLDPVGRGGWWALSLALALGASGLFCQSPTLGAGLLAVGLCTLIAAAAPRWAKWLSGLALGLALCLVLLALLLGGLAAWLTAVWEVVLPGETPGSFVLVEVRDPGAMGRTRYFATEFQELLSLGDLGRVGRVTGRDSGVSGEGQYWYVVDAYFERG